MIERTMVRLEQNRDELSDIRIFLAHKKADLVGLGKLSTIEELLEKCGSDLAVPQTPPTILKK